MRNDLTVANIFFTDGSSPKIVVLNKKPLALQALVGGSTVARDENVTRNGQARR
jgi:hypothetical protein